MLKVITTLHYNCFLIFKANLNLCLQIKLKQVLNTLFHDEYSGKVVSAIMLTLHEKCLYSKYFCSVFSRIRTEYRDILREWLLGEIKRQHELDYLTLFL